MSTTAPLASVSSHWAACGAHTTVLCRSGPATIRRDRNAVVEEKSGPSAEFQSAYFQVPEWAAAMPVEMQQIVQEDKQNERKLLMVMAAKEKIKRMAALAALEAKEAQEEEGDEAAAAAVAVPQSEADSADTPADGGAAAAAAAAAAGGADGGGPLDDEAAKKRKFQQEKRRQLKAKQEARRRQLDQEMYEMERNFEQLAAQSADEVLQETSSAAGARPT